VDVAALDLGCSAELRFWVEFVREDGAVRRVPLAVCAGERFEDAVPVRSFHWVKGAAHIQTAPSRRTTDTEPISAA
jgi:hypothetical protein